MPSKLSRPKTAHPSILRTQTPTPAAPSSSPAGSRPQTAAVGDRVPSMSQQRQIVQETKQQMLAQREKQQLGEEVPFRCVQEMRVCLCVSLESLILLILCWLVLYYLKNFFLKGWGGILTFCNNPQLYRIHVSLLYLKMSDILLYLAPLNMSLVPGNWHSFWLLFWGFLSVYFIRKCNA